MLKRFLQLVVNPIGVDSHQNPWEDPETPDRLIAERLIRSFTEDFDRWVSVRKLPRDYEKTRGGCPIRETEGKKNWAPCETPKSYGLPATYTLTNKKLGVTLSWGFVCKPRYSEGYKLGHKYALGFCTVNDILLSLAASDMLKEGYDRVKKAVEQANLVAAAAKKAMEENEKKWNLAENLLGMKRTKSGALVPAEMLCECGDAKGQCLCVNERTKVKDCCDLAGRPHLVCEFFPN